MRNLFRRALMVVPALVVTALLLTSCAPTTVDSLQETTSQAGWYNAQDGREVYCFRVGYGLSCDWENAREIE